MHYDKEESKHCIKIQFSSNAISINHLLCIWIVLGTVKEYAPFMEHFFFFFGPHHMACGILVPQPGITLAPPPFEAQSLNHWTTW